MFRNRTSIKRDEKRTFELPTQCSECGTLVLDQWFEDAQPHPATETLSVRCNGCEELLLTVCSEKPAVVTDVMYNKEPDGGYEVKMELHVIAKTYVTIRRSGGIERHIFGAAIGKRL
jgi:hypothetical protein